MLAMRVSVRLARFSNFVFYLPMTITVKNNTDLVVPASIRRQAGIKSGDRLQFKVSPHTITITAAVPPTYKATKAELAAIRKGEAEIARGECCQWGGLQPAAGFSPPGGSFQRNR